VLPNFLGDASEYLLSLLSDVFVIVFEMDVDRWAIEYVNPQIDPVLGYLPEEVLAEPGFWLEHVTHADDRAALLEVRARALAGELTDHTYRGLRRDGRTVWLHERSRVVVDQEGRGRLRATVLDVTAEHEAQERYRLLAEATDEIVIVHQHGLIVDANPAFVTQIGYGLDEARSLQPERWLPSVDGAAVGLAESDVEIRTREGDRRLMRTRGMDASYQGAPARIVVMRDVTEDRMREADALRRAETDHLTGLLNRAALERDLHRVCAAARRGEAAALVFCDLNGFKQINDRRGHDAGDLVLCEVAVRLNRLARDHEQPYRLSGDEFVILAHTVTAELAELAAASISRRIEESISAPIPHEDGNLMVTPAVGVALCPRDARTPEHLLSHADHAMYADKRARKQRTLELGWN
jgi:diguanylate cyclase (GGDEF)-like protein/PAS domain S-box-containing protein